MFRRRMQNIPSGNGKVLFSVIVTRTVRTSRRIRISIHLDGEERAGYFAKFEFLVSCDGCLAVPCARCHGVVCGL